MVVIFISSDHGVNRSVVLGLVIVHSYIVKC